MSSPTMATGVTRMPISGRDTPASHSPGADVAADQLRQLRDTRGFFRVTAQLGLKDHAGQPCGMCLQ